MHVRCFQWPPSMSLPGSLSDGESVWLCAGQYLARLSDAFILMTVCVLGCSGLFRWVFGLEVRYIESYLPLEPFIFTFRSCECA